MSGSSSLWTKHWQPYSENHLWAMDGGKFKESEVNNNLFHFNPKKRTSYCDYTYISIEFTHLWAATVKWIQ